MPASADYLLHLDILEVTVSPAGFTTASEADTNGTQIAKIAGFSERYWPHGLDALVAMLALRFDCLPQEIRVAIDHCIHRALLAVLTEARHRDNTNDLTASTRLRLFGAADSRLKFVCDLLDEIARERERLRGSGQ